jgi:hypothetical protein
VPVPPNAQASRDSQRHGRSRTPDRRGRERRVQDSRHGVRRAPDRGTEPATRPSADPAGDVVRWAVFSTLLAPVVLVVYGTSLGGAAAAALGLAAVTAVCRLLLRQSERAAARQRAEEARRAAEGASGARGGGRAAYGAHRTPDGAQGGLSGPRAGNRHSRTGGQGAHRGSRARGESAPGD